MKEIVRIHTIHSIGGKEAIGLNKRFNNFFYKRCNVIPIALSENVKKTILNTYKAPKIAKNIKVVNNGIDLQKFKIKTNYTKENNKDLIILHIGRFARPKNHKSLIKVFKRLSQKHLNIKLWLIGDGQQKSDIINLVKDLNLIDKVSFLGLKEDVENYLYQADIFVLPSLWEGMPITIIEAMATGLPIVSTNVGGVSEMLENKKSGIIVEVNEDEIFQAINNLIENEKMRKIIGTNALLQSKKFSSKRMANEYIQIYKESLGNKI